MPTENRSSNTEMVSVPRDLLERLDLGKNTATALAALPELRALLAQPAQHQGEPVGEVVAFGKGLHEIAWAAGRIPRLGAKLYTHSAPADPGEVERLRAEIERMRERVTPTHKSLIGKHAEIIKERDTLKRRVQNADLALAAQTKQVHTLRAQLAERDALLSCWMNLPRAASSPELNEVRRKTDYLLSASAEPVAPVERDELAMTKAFHDWAFYKKGEAIGRMDGQQAALEGFIAGADWQARAALERKP